MIHNNINYKNISFIISIQNIHQLPNDNITEIAFIGRSNSGKSSTINTLANQKIAKISKKPGCTKLINLFEVPIKIRLIDFPGYGYANIPKQERKKWETAINHYLKNRKNLNGIILIIDIRRSINKIDKKIINKTKNTNIPMLILLNKSDKISNYESLSQLKKIEKNIFSEKIKIITFSTKKLTGIKYLKRTINHWHNNTLTYKKF